MGSWEINRDENGLYTCRNCGDKFSAKETRRRVYCSQACLEDYKRVGGPEQKTCEQCGDEYQPHPITASRQRFCGDECQRAWWLENREEHGKVYTYTCENCGDEYETNFSNRDTCCSRECASELHSKRAQVEKECIVCGNDFIERASGLGYCSPECQEIGVTYTVACIQCGEEFETPAGPAAHQICSEECRLERHREQYEEYMIEKVGDRSYVCQECGKEFIAPYGDKRRRFCSRSCSRRLNKRTRLARKRTNGEVERISSVLVYERDGWACGVCGEPVDPELEYPHPDSASLDHIVPIAKGGTHTWRNVQCSHLRCNRDKSDVGGGQLRLGIAHQFIRA